MASKRPVYTPLRQRKDFLHLTKYGQKVYPAQWMVVNFEINNRGEMRCGWTVPRYVGSAVIRNRLKRWCREFFRERLKKSSENYRKSLDINVVFRRNRAKGFYKNLSHDEFNKVLSRGFKKVQQKVSANSDF